MVDLIKANDIFGTTNFSSPTEFWLALTLAKVCTLYNKALDMSMMSVDANSLPTNYIEVYKEMVSYGSICIDRDTYCKDSITAYEDVEYFNEILLYDEEGSTAVWSFDWVESNYGCYLEYFRKYNKTIASSIFLVVATFILRKYLGLEEKDKILFKFDSSMTRNVFAYIDIYSCRCSMPWFERTVDLEVEKSDKSVGDLDYIVFCRNAHMSNKYGYHTDSEKLEYMKEKGMQVGSILVLWERKGICPNARYGKLSSATIVRLDEVGDDFLGFATIALNKTKEEIRKEYYDIPEDKRYIFSDILNKKPMVSPVVKPLMFMGIEEYFENEEFLLTRLDPSEKVTKLVTVDGEEGYVEMSGIDAIYWLLRQYDIEFDVDIFRGMYGAENDLLWDLCQRK